MGGEHEALAKRAEALETELADLRAQREAVEADGERLEIKAAALRAKVDEAHALPVRTYRGVGMMLAILAVSASGTLGWLMTIEHARLPTAPAPSPMRQVPAPTPLPAGVFQSTHCAVDVECAAGQFCVAGRCELPSGSRRRIVPGR